MYHDIRDFSNTDYKSRIELKSFLTVDQFKSQLDYLIKNYRIISTNDLLDSDNVCDDKCAILTFDDGLKDHYEVASILSDHNIKGTFLIPTVAIKDRLVIKSHKIQFILASENEMVLVDRIFDYFNLSPLRSQVMWNKFSWSKWKDNWWTPEMVFITNILRNHEMGTQITDELFADLVTKDEEDFCGDFYLTESQVGDLVSSGMEVGGHGYLSESLTLLDQEGDIPKSLEYIKSFHNNDLVFSYPNGEYNDKTLSLMAQYGCKFSYTTVSKSITKDFKNLEIPRFDGPRYLPL
tara:strand:- start:4940 stop:5818 length:879 start_codon:yes stop_codon:yes gene_type:complete